MLACLFVSFPEYSADQPDFSLCDNHMTTMWKTKMALTPSGEKPAVNTTFVNRLVDEKVVGRQMEVK